MLVLSRKAGQTIRIGDEITLKVIEVRGNRVRIGIDAPVSCNILRGELDFSGCSESEEEPVAAHAAFDVHDWQADHGAGLRLAGNQMQ